MVADNYDLRCDVCAGPTAMVLVFDRPVWVCAGSCAVPPSSSASVDAPPDGRPQSVSGVSRIVKGGDDAWCAVSRFDPETGEDLLEAQQRFFAWLASLGWREEAA